VDTKNTIRKFLFIAMWLVIGGGMLTLLIAAVGRQKRNTCKDYSITIRSSQGNKSFISKGDITSVLKTATKGNIKGQSKSAFNLLAMEQRLEGNGWVKDAQLYFDNKDILHVIIKERQPVARVFTAAGKSFLVDADGKVMPLPARRDMKLPVFTGFPDKKIKTKQDSLLVGDITAAARLINGDTFWAAQVAQVDIARSGTDGSWEFEMIPVLGNHIIKLGNGHDLERKFGNLLGFYKQVLSRTGLDKYKTIDVRFKGQVIGAKSENPKVDSVQLRKNVESLLQQIKQMDMEAEKIRLAMSDSLAGTVAIPQRW
jgi:cell division protein FtsQ